MKCANYNSGTRLHQPKTSPTARQTSNLHHSRPKGQTCARITSAHHVTRNCADSQHMVGVARYDKSTVIVASLSATLLLASLGALRLAELHRFSFRGLRRVPNVRLYDRLEKVLLHELRQTICSHHGGVDPPANVRPLGQGRVFLQQTLVRSRLAAPAPEVLPERS